MTTAASNSEESAQGAAPPEDSAKLRLFFALHLPEEWRQTLGALERRLEAQHPGYARWVRPELLHLTIVFLGYQPRARLEQIVAAGRRAAASSSPFDLGPGEPGTFGPKSRPRVVWLGVVDRSRSLPRLHQATSQALAEEHIPFDERPLAPHITLGRAQPTTEARAGRALAASLGAVHPRALGLAPFTVKALCLMRSELSAAGPRYTEIARLPLGQVQP